MKTKLVSLTGFFLAALSVASTGCRTAASNQLEKQSKSSNLELPAGTVVRVRMPEAGRYYQALFQAPATAHSLTTPPQGWTGDWIKGEAATAALKRDVYGLIFFPMVVASSVHTLGGTALHQVAGIHGNYPQDERSRDVAAMVAAARSRFFEQDLRQAVRNELRENGLLAIDGHDSSGPGAAGVTLDLYIIEAGMIRDQSSSKGGNPPQALHLKVRAEVAGASNSPVTMRVTFDSERARFREWAANGASRFAAVRAESIETLAADLVEQLTATPQPARRSPPETHLALQP